MKNSYGAQQVRREGEGGGNTEGDKNEKTGLDDRLSPDREVNMIALSKSQFDGQPWVNPDRTTVPNEEVASSPVPSYSGSFFLGEVSRAFVRSESRGSARGCCGAGSGACGRRGRGGLRRRASESVVAIVRGLGEGWVDRRVG